MTGFDIPREQFRTTPDQSGDPAHGIGRDGRTLLQSRLTSYALALLLFYLAYYPAFYLIWSRDPGFGSRAALAHITHWSALSLGLLYAFFWQLFRARVWPVSMLVVMDVAFHGAIGVIYAPNILSRPTPLIAAFEGLLATMSVLAIRALLVPSSVRRTIVAGTLLCASPLAMLLDNQTHFSASGLAFPTLLVVYVTWSGISVAFSAFASSVLYGLRREVQKAQRFGQYTLLEKLGEGGMGVVYRAKHAMLRRPTAIKLLNATNTVSSLARFEQEAQLMADLTHPNTVTVHDYGCTADGVFYYAMEYLEGADLELLVDVDGPQPPARVIHVLGQVCGALGEAHARGLIHRDIKPANLFLCRDRAAADAVKVLDFGVVKDLKRLSDATAEHALIGTPLYMSPEAIAGKEALDARSDLYSLGAVGYFLLCGQPVFSGRSVVEICAQHLHAVPVPPSVRLAQSLPDDVEGVIMRCLEKTPDKRPASAVELAAALAGCAAAGSWDGEHARIWWADNDSRLVARRAVRAAGGERHVSIARQQTVAIARAS